MNRAAKSTAYQSAGAAALMLFYGFYLANWTGFSTDDLYLLAIDVFKWTLKIGGACMFIAAFVCFLGQRAGLLLDCFVSGTCGIIIAACGAIWLIKGSTFDIQDLVILVFGLLFIRAAWVSWTNFTASDAPDSPPIARAPEPIHPASVPSNALPNADQPAPPDGFLAALANEKDEPPTASYE